jgi:hypothetical protein
MYRSCVIKIMHVSFVRNLVCVIYLFLRIYSRVAHTRAACEMALVAKTAEFLRVFGTFSGFQWALRFKMSQ